MENGGCVLLYCDEGYHPEEKECVVCPKGTYSNSQDLDVCRPCEIPTHSDPLKHGEVTPKCAYRCHTWTLGVFCNSINIVVTPTIMLIMMAVALLVFLRRVEARRKRR